RPATGDPRGLPRQRANTPVVRSRCAGAPITKAVHRNMFGCGRRAAPKVVARSKCLLDRSRRSRYVSSMTRKIAISLPDSTLKKAKDAVRSGKARNVSNYVARLIEHASAAETFEGMIADWVRESGATEEEIHAAEEESREAFERVGLVPKDKRREKQ